MKNSKMNYTPFIIAFVIILIIALVFYFATKKKENFVAQSDCEPDQYAIDKNARNQTGCCTFSGSKRGKKGCGPEDQGYDSCNCKKAPCEPDQYAVDKNTRGKNRCCTLIGSKSKRGKKGCGPKDQGYDNCDCIDAPLSPAISAMAARLAPQNKRFPPGYTAPSFDIMSKDLTKLPWQRNHAPNFGGNQDIDALRTERMMRVQWPEFSWMFKGKRAFQLFPTDISRVGYDNEGNVITFICPQFVRDAGPLGRSITEVTVNSQRGYIDESKLPMTLENLMSTDNANLKEKLQWGNFDMDATVQMWFPDLVKSSFFSGGAALQKILHFFGVELPTTKANAIQVGATDPLTGKSYLSLKPGRNPEFQPPSFTLHPEACAVAHLTVLINPEPDKLPDWDNKNNDHAQFRSHATFEFHKTLFKILNVFANDLLKGVLTWNINMSCPEKVNIQDWETHRKKWQHSTTDGIAHTGQGLQRYANGSLLPGEPGAPDTVNHIVGGYNNNLFVVKALGDLVTTLIAYKARLAVCSLPASKHWPITRAVRTAGCFYK